jgi:5-oxoprolinase (ATP-hydrolysing)
MRINWHISVDTGGTFTDCIAESPLGETEFIKVLSSGRVGGKVVGYSNTKISIELKSKISKNLYSGYQCIFPAFNYQSLVVNHDIHGHFELQKSIPEEFNFANTIVYLTANEEAPILAARLATKTPLAESLPKIMFRLGTTKGTNALLEGKGSNTTLIVSKGFKDLLAIGTQQRPELFALNIIKRQSLPNSIIEVDEYINANGQVETPLSNDSIKNCIAQLLKSESKSVAIALKNSYQNTQHEVALAEAIKSTTGLHITCSAVLYPAIKYLTRTETAVVNAYLSPILNDYFDNIAGYIDQNNIRVMTSAGALAKLATFNAKDSLLSGPAGGIVGAAKAANMAGFEQVLTIDMGGTSTDVSRYDRGFDYNSELTVGDAHLFSQTLAIETVAAGGGSVCKISDGRLIVGPASAGAMPGPACYGNDGPLTITDLNLLSGRVDADAFGIPLNELAAKEALTKVLDELRQKHLGANYDDLLSGFLAIANQKMADAVKKISINKGFDPQEYGLLGFGGAIGQHICDIARLLRVANIIVPYNGSLLSAVGISKAIIERHEIKQILAPLKNKELIENAINETKNFVLKKITKDGVNLPEISSIAIFLRLYGQDTTIEIPLNSYDSLTGQFKEKYIDLFGHWVERDIEVESIRVTAVDSEAIAHAITKTEFAGVSKIKTSGSRNILFSQGWLAASLFEWPQYISIAQEIEGPAVIYNPFTSIVINPGWTAMIENEYLIISYQGKDQHTEEKSSIEAVELALYTNRFKSVAEQMGSLLQRTALSVNIKERLDFSCALLDREGKLVVNAPHIPVHLGSLGICTRAVVDYLKLEEGDIVITNHPAFGGSHLPDVTLIAPVYYDKQLVGYVANRAHHAEIGGKAPGSMPADARNLAEEGVVIPPTLIVSKGKSNWHEIINILNNALYPSRSTDDNIADFQAAVASIYEGQKTMQKLLQAHGKKQMLHFMNELSNLATAKLKTKLDELKITSLSATEYLDDDSMLKVTISYNSKLKISFKGTSSTNKGNLNATEAIVNGAVIYVLKLLIGGDIPLNEGLMRQVELEIPAGSLLNPVFSDNPLQCPAVVGGNTEVSQRLVDTLIKAFGLAACSQGTMNNFLFGNDTFGYYETICGGTGAGPGFNGTDAVHQHMTNTQITDPEILEFRYPVKLNQFSIRENSGGEGKWHGGEGVIREFEFREPVIITFLTQHRKQAPYGLEGGFVGATGEQFWITTKGESTKMDGIGTYKLGCGDKVRILTPGGGGYGENN